MGNNNSTTAEQYSGHGSGVDEQEKSSVNTTTTTEQQPQEGSCPATRGYKHPYVYNVYGERIDPNNQMPATANQQPYPGQRFPLSTERIKSTIRKGGTDSTWLYPSQQMFYNALRRKGKGDNIDEEDMDAVVAIHNGVNEMTWQKVLKWEKTLHSHECDDPTLLRFRGRPMEMSPKAYLKHWFLGYPKPFDRHDWIVDRCGVKQQRYVIDFYYDDWSPADEDITLMSKTGFVIPRRVLIDVRPALDDWESFTDRVKYLSLKLLKKFDDDSAAEEQQPQPQPQQQEDSKQ